MFKRARCGKFNVYSIFALNVYSTFIQKSSKRKEAKETGPQVGRANLGGPDLQLLRDKIHIIIQSNLH